jgi:hypothetical protein
LKNVGYFIKANFEAFIGGTNLAFFLDCEIQELFSFEIRKEMQGAASDEFGTFPVNKNTGYTS